MAIEALRSLARVAESGQTTITVGGTTVAIRDVAARITALTLAKMSHTPLRIAERLTKDYARACARIDAAIPQSTGRKGRVSRGRERKAASNRA